MDTEALIGRMLKYGPVENVELDDGTAEVVFKDASTAEKLIKELHHKAFKSYPDFTLEITLLKDNLTKGHSEENAKDVIMEEPQVPKAVASKEAAKAPSPAVDISQEEKPQPQDEKSQPQEEKSQPEGEEKSQPQEGGGEKSQPKEDAPRAVPEEPVKEDAALWQRPAKNHMQMASQNYWNQLEEKVNGERLVPPEKPVAEWEESMGLKDQLKLFRKMDRCGLLNRYLVVGNMEEKYLSCQALRAALDWNIRSDGDSGIISIELHSLSSKRDVAHITLKDIKAACTLRAFIMEKHPTWKVALCSPRKASRVLWIGSLPQDGSWNVNPWYVRPVEELLGHYGKLRGGLRFISKAFCGFATFERQSEAVRARNALYGYPLKVNAETEPCHLNVDFAEDDEDEEEELPLPPRRQSRSIRRRSRSRRRRSVRRSRSRRMLRRSAPRRSPPRRSPPRRSPRRDAPRRSPRRRSPPRRRRERSRTRSARRDHRVRVEEKKPRAEETAPPVEDKPKEGRDVRVSLYKMGDFACATSASFLKGDENMRKGFQDSIRLDIDQRTKLEHVISHKARNEGRWAVWRLTPETTKKGTEAYDELFRYFVDRQRVGLVQTKTAHVYIVPPDPTFLEGLKLDEEGQQRFALALQIPLRK